MNSSNRREPWYLGVFTPHNQYLLGAAGILTITVEVCLRRP